MSIKFNKNDIYDVYLFVNKFYGKYIIEDDLYCLVNYMSLN